jgi:neurotransmitter:Na+ symporter, NSS family
MANGTAERWGSRYGFLLAAVGSAIGLGNIWRFPYIAYSNGGGAFFVPYLFALLTAGVPLLALEYAMGHRWRGSAPLVFRRMHRRTEWIGWWQVAVAFVISSYYAVVLAWALAYAWYSVGLQWGDAPGEFFQGTFLRTTAEPGQIGGLVPAVVVPLVLVWAVNLAINYAGVSNGIERAVRWMIPTLIISFAVLVVRAITLPGAAEGLNALFTPDFSALTDSSVWVAAYGQIFFTLSIAFAIMITFSSYLPRQTDLTDNAFIAAFANCSFELLAGIGVFAAIGFIASQTGVPVDEAATDGVGLAFVAFPQIISQLPGLNSLFGVLFFGSLVLAGLTSLISIVEVMVAALRDKFGLSRHTAVVLGGGTCAAVSLLYATQGGLYILDTADNFINSFGIVLAGLAEVIVVAWLLRRLGGLRQYANALSEIRLGRWWMVALAGITPLMLIVQAVLNFQTNLTSNYEGYPTGFLVVAGWGVAAAALIAGILLSLRAWDPATVTLDEPDGVITDTKRGGA